MLKNAENFTFLYNAAAIENCKREILNKESGEMNVFPSTSIILLRSTPLMSSFVHFS